jgi:predicted TIM-barrel fold metal-dependent hydrolase
MQLKPIINTHCHLLNFKFIPDKMTKLLSNIPEDLADDKWFSVAAGILVTILPGSNYERIKKFLKIYRSDIDDVVRYYIQELDEAQIDICVPLMMDLEKAVPIQKKGNILYKDQIKIIAKQTAKYPWRIFPFVMFDPRRKNAFTLCKDAIEKLSFIGIKMYPALGYHPSHRSEKNSKTAKNNLLKLYTYCGEKQIPITTHASVGGAYSLKADKNREKNVWPLTEISNWIDPIREFNLKINFAHLGGNYLNNTDKKRIQSATWKREILNFISRSQTENNFGKIYADLSYHDMALDSRMQKDYFKGLRQLMETDGISQGILFGTDASMISHTWSEKEFIQPFTMVNNLPSLHQNKIFTDNPINFLFENAQIPKSYCDFVKNAATPASLSNLPPWIKQKGNKYYIVVRQVA